jgi:uroporphyrin-III C-methyltransferase
MIRRAGEVYLVGAGPGDPELMTIKGLRLLRSADVVVHDRLIGHDLLRHCREDAEVIDVGKYPDHHRISQQQINRILVDRAGEGLMVVRLKGGDPFVFGRGMEELEACRAAHLPCHVVPGISSAIAGPASAGIPVTSRGIARSFAVITGRTDPGLPGHTIDFAALAKIDTVIFMMGRSNLRSLADGLMEAGREASTPATCVQNATMPDEKVVTGCLADIADRVDAAGLKSPLVTLVGEVAGLADPEVGCRASDAVPPSIELDGLRCYRQPVIRRMRIPEPTRRAA